MVLILHISGETSLEPVEGVKFVMVKTASEMFRETLNNLPVDVAILMQQLQILRQRSAKEKIKKMKILILN